MGSKQFCLKWSHHQRNLLNNFGDLLDHEAFVDVTLACDGVCLKAHKVVLSACSPYFQKILIENPCQHPVVILQNIKCDEMQAILSFMYKGEMNVSQEQISAILKIAEGLKVKGLTEVTNEDFQASNRKHARPTVISVPTEERSSPPAKRKKRSPLSRPMEANLTQPELQMHLLPQTIMPVEQSLTLPTQSSSFQPPVENVEREELPVPVSMTSSYDCADHGPCTSKDRPPMHELMGFMETSLVEIERNPQDLDATQDPSMDFSYIKSTRGGDFVVRYGFLFKLNKTGPGGKKYYRCYRDSKTGCKARAIISGRQIIDVEEHNHETDDLEIAKREHKMLSMRNIMEAPIALGLEDLSNHSRQESIIRTMKQEMEESARASVDDGKTEEDEPDDYSMERHHESKSSVEETWYNSLSTQNSKVDKSTVGAS